MNSVTFLFIMALASATTLLYLQLKAIRDEQELKWHNLDIQLYAIKEALKVLNSRLK